MDRTRLNILLVDDEESFVKVVALGLQDEYEFDIAIAYSGDEAIKAIEANKNGFDVVVLDYRMPGMTGLDVLRWMNVHRIETPSFMLTGAGSESVAVEAMKLGAYDYCRKEDADLSHLANLIRATHERHMFRVTDALEQERTKEIVLNKEATDKAHEVINLIAPALNSAFANIAAELEIRQGELYATIPEDVQVQLKQLFGGLQQELHRIEHAVRGLLALSGLLYARHPEATEIDRLRKEFEERSQQRAGHPS
ncbi:MAG: two component system response regulator [Bacteroidetes bacterium]|nr:two component system response regulator [Bacteroidota bacterium]